MKTKTYKSWPFKPECTTSNDDFTGESSFYEFDLNPFQLKQSMVIQLGFLICLYRLVGMNQMFGSVLLSI